MASDMSAAMNPDEPYLARLAWNTVNRCRVKVGPRQADDVPGLISGVAVPDQVQGAARGQAVDADPEQA